jgi:hypothetical protein
MPRRGVGGAGAAPGVAGPVTSDALVVLTRLAGRADHPGEPLRFRAPLPAGSGLIRCAAHAMAREAVLLRASVPGRPRTAAYRLPVPLLGNGLRSRTRAVLAHGAVVYAVAPPGSRLLDRIAAEAGQAACGIPRPGSGGAVSVRSRDLDGRPRLLRVGLPGHFNDPARAAEGLRRAATASSPYIPRITEQGCTLGLSWTVEERLPGRRPPRLTSVLFTDAAAFCANLPPSGAPARPGDGARALADWFPDRAGGLGRLARVLDATLGDLPGVVRHGDLWTGNLLALDGRLTGVVDWDAWSEDGVPALDLVHLIATEERLRLRRPIGAVYAQMPWRRPEVRALLGQWWPALDRNLARVDALGTAWWSTQLATDIARTPALASNPRWVADNIHAVLDPNAAS